MKRIWLSSPHMSDERYEQEYVKEAFETNWIAPLGPNVNGFEDEICDYVGVSNALAVVSGTSAIHLALKAAGVKRGDVVICQSLTFAATVNPVIYEGATPVFVDSDYKTWNMDPNLLEDALNKYPNTKAVLVVHLYGISADMDRIVEICKKNNVTLIEDAAESLGTTYKGSQTGSFGDYSIFSFNGNKIITTSGGGMLIAPTKERRDKCFFWATQSREKERHYEHKELGYNYRMSNVTAGIGRGQLKVLEQRIEKKRHIFEYYRRGLKDVKCISFMPQNEWERSNCWLSVIQIEGKIKPTTIIEALEAHGIESRPVWKPMHLQPYYAKYDFIGGCVSNDLFNNGICLPSDTKLSNEDLRRIINIIRGVIDE